MSCDTGADERAARRAADFVDKAGRAVRSAEIRLAGHAAEDVRHAHATGLIRCLGPGVFAPISYGERNGTHQHPHPVERLLAFMEEAGRCVSTDECRAAGFNASHLREARDAGYVLAIAPGVWSARGYARVPLSTPPREQAPDSSLVSGRPYFNAVAECIRQARAPVSAPFLLAEGFTYTAMSQAVAKGLIWRPAMGLYAAYGVEAEPMTADEARERYRLDRAASRWKPPPRKAPGPVRTKVPGTTRTTNIGTLVDFVRGNGRSASMEQIQKAGIAPHTVYNALAGRWLTRSGEQYRLGSRAKTAI